MKKMSRRELVQLAATLTTTGVTQRPAEAAPFDGAQGRPFDCTQDRRRS